MSEDGDEFENEKEEMKRVPVDYPASIYERMQDLPHGKVSEISRDMWRSYLYGEDAGQRTRLEQQLERLRKEDEEDMKTIRQAQARIEDRKIREQKLEQKISNLTSTDDRYEAKLEELEYSLRRGDIHAYEEFPRVQRVADAGKREPAGVIQDLKERNPDVPAYAFEPAPPAHERDGLHTQRWNGVPDDEVETPVENREGKYR